VQRATISNQIQGHRSFDEKMAELNLDIPGFAGLWYDSAGRLTIGLVDLSQKEKARSVVATFMGNRAMARIRPVDPAQFAFVKMTFSFSELKATFDRVSDEILERHDVHGIGIDERNNAITALVASAQVTSQVAEALRAAGVPDAQASVLVRPPTVINQTLADDDNPLRGAFNIGSQNSGHGSCTSAFNVRFSGNNNTYIATASHCSKTQGGLDTGAYAWYNTNGWVGYEAYDVGWITCGSYKCQDADVALVDYSLGGRTPAFGKIANTTGWGSTTVSQTDTLSIIGIELYPILNETVQRLGLVTGKTVGDIYDTCVDVKGTTGTPPGRNRIQNQVLNAGELRGQSRRQRRPGVQRWSGRRPLRSQLGIAHVQRNASDRELLHVLRSHVVLLTYDRRRIIHSDALNRSWSRE
jgi:hypothetical protein